MDVEGYKRLSRMLSDGNRGAGKGNCDLSFEMLAQHAEDILAIVLPPRDIEDPAFHDKLRQLADLFDRPLLPRRHIFCSAATTRSGWPYLDNLADTNEGASGRDQRRALSRPERRALHDVVTAIRLKCTVEDLAFAASPRPNAISSPPQEMERLFREYPHAIERIREIVDRCNSR